MPEGIDVTEHYQVHVLNYPLTTRWCLPCSEETSKYARKAVGLIKDFFVNTGSVSSEIQRAYCLAGKGYGFVIFSVKEKINTVVRQLVHFTQPYTIQVAKSGSEINSSLYSGKVHRAVGDESYFPHSSRRYFLWYVTSFRPLCQCKGLKCSYSTVTAERMFVSEVRLLSDRRICYKKLVHYGFQGSQMDAVFFGGRPIAHQKDDSTCHPL